MKATKYFSLLCALLLFASAGCGNAQGEADTGPAKGAAQAASDKDTSRATALTLSDLKGNTVSVNPGDGKVYVLNFWATWCPPCRGEMPELDEFAKKHKEDLSFYAINLQESKGKVQDFLADNGLSMPVLLDADGKAGDAYQIRAIPTTIVIDGKGNVAARHTGAITQDQLESILKDVK